MIRALLLLLLLASLGGTARAALLDGFGDASRWTASASDQVRATLRPARGALCLDADFNGVSGYAVMRRELPIAWPDDFELTLQMSGAGAVNDVQVKFIAGDDVWWVARRDVALSARTVEWRLRRRHVAFAWGPTADRTLRATRAVEVVVAAGQGAAGGGRTTLCVSRLALAPRAPDPAVWPVPTLHARGDRLDIDLHTQRDFNGLLLRWPAAAGDHDVIGSDDGRRWTLLRRVRGSDGGLDALWLPEAQARRLRIERRRGGSAWPSVALRSAADWPDRNAMVAELAAAAPRGDLPRAFLGQQNHWTLVGVDGGGGRSALLSEDGAIEVGRGGWSVEPALLMSDGRRVTWADARIGQTLRDDVLPVVQWTHPDVHLTVEAAADGNAAGPQLLARYTVHNPTSGRLRVTLLLAVRPWQVNPPQQFLTTPGGVRDLARIVWRSGGALVADGRALLPSEPPDRVSALPFDGGLALATLAAAPALAGALDDPQALASAALQWTLTLAPGASRSIGWTAALGDATPGAGTWRDARWDARGGAGRDAGTGRGVGRRRDGRIAPRADALHARHARTGRGIDARLDARIDSRIDARADTRFDPGIEARAGARADGRPDTRFDPRIEARSDTRPDPRPDPRIATRLATRIDAAAAAWRARLARVAIDAGPDAAPIVHTLRTALAHILVSRDGWALRPGTRSYARTWVRDGAMMVAALVRLGELDAARDFADGYARHIFASGKVPCCVDARGADPVAENDSHGEYLFAVAEVWRSGGADVGTSFLARHWPRVQAVVGYMETLRRSTLTDATPPHLRGLLPPSISHEGYSDKPAYAYWDDFWALRGYSDAVEIAAALGHDADAERWRRWRDAFARDLQASIAASAALHGMSVVPGAADRGDFDPTSTTVAITPAQAPLPPGLRDATWQRYWQEALGRIDGTRPWRDYTPYELRNVGVLVRLGQPDRAHALLRWFMAHRRPPGWQQWAEVVLPDARAPHFLGDMPHAWVASDFVRSALDLFVHDRGDDTLVLGAGWLPAWRDHGIRVRGLVTAHGVVDLGLTPDMSGGWTLDLPQRTTAQLVLAWPGDDALPTARHDGRTLAWRGRELPLPPPPATITLSR